jgi:tRNA pseudouridine13 synthase
MVQLNLPEEPTGEEECGLLGFATAATGIGGKLRTTPEDFVVVEDSLMPPEDGGGRVTAVSVRARNWETNRLVRMIARQLRISPKRIRFAGTKDKRAVTTQLMTIEAPMEEVQSLRLTDVEILSQYPTDRHVTLGDLVGNAFEVAVRGLEEDSGTIEGRLEEVIAGVDSLGGFPNFYGVQRFGVHRPVSHMVGRALAGGDIEGACWTYLTHVGPGEDEAAKAARRSLAETRDARAALRDFPEVLSHERNMLNHLVHHPDDPTGALARLPFNLQLMFVHAYQGLLFNLVLCERLRRGLPIGTPVEGDLVLPVDDHGGAVHDRFVPVRAHNLSKVERQVERGRALVSGLVPGTESMLAEGEMGDIEAQVLESAGISFEDFRIPVLTDLTSAGIRRELVIPGVRPDWNVSEDVAEFSFRLHKGCYATTVLREFMKAPIMSY